MRYFAGLPAAAVRHPRRSIAVRVACALFLLLAPFVRGDAQSGQVAQLAYTQGPTITTPTSTENAPGTVAVDGSGNVYNSIGNTIYKGTLSGGTYSYASTGIAISGGSYVAVDPNGIIYVASSVTSETSTPYLTRYTPSGSGYSPTPLLSGFRYVVLGLSVDPAGNAFVVALVPNGSAGPTVQEVLAGTTNSTNLVTLTSSSLNAFTVDSNDNLLIAYGGQGPVVTVIPKVNGTYSATTNTFNTLCTNCSVTGLAADTGGNVYSSYVNDGSGGAERYIRTGNGTYSAGVVFTDSQSPERIAVGATGIVYTIDGYSFNVVTHVPPQAINFGTYNTDSVSPASQSATINFVLDAGITYQGFAFLGQAGSTNFASPNGTATCGQSSCAGNGTYPAGTVISIPSVFNATAVGTRFGVLKLNSTSGTIATAYLTGTGGGPLLTYLPAAFSTITPSSGSVTPRTPAAIATDSGGNAYVIDTALQQLLKVVPSSGQVSTLATGLNVTSATAAAPALDPGGNVYFVQSDPAHPGLFEVNQLNTLDGGNSYRGTTIIQASLKSPQAIAVDATGDVFVLDGSTNQVTEYVNINGSYLPRIVLSNLTNTHGLAVGADGSLYIATGPGLFRSTLVNGTYGAPVSLTTGATTAFGVALDSVGNIYVNDASNDRVLRLTPSGGAATTLYTSGTTINGVAATPSGNVLLAEDNGTIGLLTLSTPPSLNFASTPVGRTSSDSPQTLTFVDTGNASFVTNSTSPTITSPFALSTSSTCTPAFNAGNVVLAQNASCTFLISFTPTASGAVTGSLKVPYYSKGGNGPQVIVTDVLSGTGTLAAPTVQVNSSTQAYATATSATLTATVTYSGSTAPTGAVTFVVGTSPQTTQQATCTATSTGVRTCTISLSTTNLTAGQYSITVNEAADSTYQAASGTGTFTVTRATPSITASAPSSTYGNTALILTAQVSYASAAGFRQPSGPFTFSVDGGAAIAATCNAASNTSLTCTATYDASSLAAGNHTLSATAAADSNYAAATSANATFTVNAAAAPAATVASSTIAYGTGSTQLAATFAYSGKTAPSGAVSFTVNNATFSATCAAGTASPRSCSITYSSSALPAGTYPVQVTEAADSNYAVATGNGTLTVTKATPTIVASAPSSTYGNTSLALNAQISYSGSAAPTGPVTFSVDGGPAVAGTCTASPNNVLGCGATYDASSLAAGTHTLSATIATDTNYATATSASATFTVNAAAAPAATIASSTIAYGAASTQLTATFAYSGKTAPSGLVTFTVNNATFNAACAAGTASPRSCSITYTSSALAPGSYPVQATEAADTNYAAATASGTLTVTKAVPTILASAPSATYGDTVLALGAQVSGSGSTGAQATTGAVTFSVDGVTPVAATCTLSSNSGTRACTANYDPSSLAVGNHTLSATIATDTNYASATSPVSNFAVNPAVPVAAVPSSTVAYGATSTQLTATFGFSGKTSPSGLVTFTVNNATYNATCTSGTVSPRTCSITYNPSTLAAGTYPVQASEAADGNYAAATGNGTLTVSTSAPAVAVSSVSVVYGAASAPLSATFNSSGSIAPTGQVTFTVNNGSPVQAATCQTNGATRTCSVSYPLPALNGGTYTIQATQAADTNFGTATGSGVLTITPAAPTLSPAALTAVYGSSGVQLTAAVAFSGSAAPAGQPTFTVNNSLLVPATCTGSASPRTCTGTLNATSLAVGQYPVSFSETADTNYSSATSASTTLTISKATPTVLASNATANFGAATTTLTATVGFTGSSAPAGGLTFTIDGGTPIAARCTGGSPTLTCTASATTSSLTVGPHAVAATETGDTNYNTASGNATLTVSQGATTLSVAPATGSAGGSAVMLTATQTFSGAAPTGLVSILINGNTLAAPCAGTTSPRTCSALFDVSKVAAGSYEYSASSVTDSSYAGTTSNTATVTLTSSTISLAAQPVTAAYGATPLALNATLTYSGANAPTGPVSFLIDSAVRVSATCTGAASPLSCSGSYTGTALTAGTHTLAATFGGDTTYAAFTSAAVSITINATPLTVTVPAFSTSYGAPSTTLTATINFTGPVAPTGNVRFQVNGGTAVTGFCNTVNSSLQCSATYPSSTLTVGQYPVVATISADANYSAATSAAGTLTVTRAQPVVTLAAVIAPYGATTVNLVATISNLQAIAPTGSVVFLVDGAAMAAPSCTYAGSVGSCTVTYNAAALSVGTHTLVVTEGADTNYNAATANTALNITRGTPLLTAPAVSVPGGSSSATLTAAVAYTGAAVPSGAVTFTLAGSTPLPATCTGTSSPLNCAASISLSSVPAGVYTLTAAIAADNNYAASAATTTLTVSPATASTFPTCTLGSIKSVSSTSNAVSLTSSCSDPAGLALTTTINWGDGTPVVPAVSNGTNTHTYASPAVQTTYTAVLTSTNSAGSTGSAVQAVTVVPIVTVASTGTANVSTTVAAQPASVPVLQVTFLCTSVSTNVGGQNVTNALPSSYGITCTSPSVSSNSTATAQVTIKTTSTTVASLMRASRSRLVEALLLPFLGLPLFAFAGMKGRGRLMSLIVATALLCLTMSGCGGSFNPPATATPKGSYYITITEVTAAGTTPPTGFVQTSLIVPLTVQ